MAKARKPRLLNGVADTAPTVTDEQRRQMIERAAYFIALKRGFAGGDATADWLAAEEEIDRRLLRATREPKRDTAATPSLGDVAPAVESRLP